MEDETRVCGGNGDEQNLGSGLMKIRGKIKIQASFPGESLTHFMLLK